MLLWTLASFVDKFQNPLVLLLLLVLYVLIDVETTQPLSHLKIPKTKYVLLVIDWLDKNNVTVVIRSMGNLCSRVNGKRNEIWTLITATMSSLYQMELENLKIRTKMGREAYLMKGGRIGRPNHSNETAKQFLDKPKSKEILSLLGKGKSLRDIAGRANCSINLVVKVKRLTQPKEELVTT
jgi:DNA invertase Pin-like site-specific DNA recombinase